LDTETITDLHGFEALGGEWDDLVREMPRPSPFMLHGWLAPWLAWYGRDTEPAVHVVRREGRLVAALPLVVRRRAGIRVAGLAGGRQSVLGDLLAAPGAGPAATEELLAAVEHSGARLLDLYGLPDGSRLAQLLGDRLTVVPRVEAPVLELGDVWEATYRDKTSSKRRQLHRRRRRQLAELGAVEVDVARTGDELVAALADAVRLHALRWDGRPDGSGFATAIGRRFHRDAYRRLAAGGIPRIVTLRVDGRAVAFHAFFLLEGRMYVHRLAFDPALARHSPGLVNTLDAIGVAAAEGARRVEFLGGDERYKLELADRFEPLCHAVGLAQGVRGHALAGAQVGAIALRRRLKRSDRLRHWYVDGLAPVRRAARRAGEGALAR
jgi:CelD/BcsL family acetyltransferase involved in cellulose biosynthesis